jgi:hypothetical protein
MGCHTVQHQVFLWLHSTKVSEAKQTCSMFRRFTNDGRWRLCGILIGMNREILASSQGGD